MEAQRLEWIKLDVIRGMSVEGATLPDLIAKAEVIECNVFKAKESAGCEVDE